MGCIRVDKMVDYLGEPLRKTLRDESPYVRKTAVICVAKLFDLNPAMCVENGFLEMLQEMVNDPNPMVNNLCIPLFCVRQLELLLTWGGRCECGSSFGRDP